MRGDQGLKPHTHLYTRTHVCTTHRCMHAHVPIRGPRLPLDGLWPRGRIFQRMGPLGPGSPYLRAREQLGCRGMDSRPLCSHPRGPLPSPPSARQAARAWWGLGGERRRGHRASSPGGVGCGGGCGLGLAEVEAQAPRPPVDTPLCWARGWWGRQPLQLLCGAQPWRPLGLAAGPAGRVRAAGWLSLISSWPTGSSSRRNKGRIVPRSGPAPWPGHCPCRALWAMFMFGGKAPPASLQGLRERGPQLQAWEPRSLAQAELARHPLQWPPYHRGHQPGCLPGALPVPSPTQTLSVARPGLMAASPGACDACHHPSTLLGQKERPLLSVCGRPPGSPEGRQEADTLCLAPHTPTFWARKLHLPPSI